MCISTAPAELNSTKIGFVADFTTKLHHLFYANSVQNLSDGPNAMILPIPGVIQKIHDTTDFGNFMEDIARHFAPVYRGTKLGTGISKGVSIVEVGAYTVLSCDSIDPEAIAKALQLVPENKRPTISADLLNWYRDFYGSKANLAICCFDSKQLTKAQPIWIEYKPKDFEMGFMPGADSHDGTPPRMGVLVDRDHQLFFGMVIDDFSKNVHFSQSVPAVINNAQWIKFNNIGSVGKNCDWIIVPHEEISGNVSLLQITENKAFA